LAVTHTTTRQLRGDGATPPTGAKGCWWPGACGGCAEPAGAWPLPVVVTLARRIIVERRWSGRICPSSSEAGPATQGQTHNQQECLVDWSSRADLE